MHFTSTATRIPEFGHTGAVQRNQRHGAAIAEDMALIHLTGTSTRKLSLLSNRLIGR